MQGKFFFYLRYFSCFTLGFLSHKCYWGAILKSQGGAKVLPPPPVSAPADHILETPRSYRYKEISQGNFLLLCNNANTKYINSKTCKSYSEDMFLNRTKYLPLKNSLQYSSSTKLFCFFSNWELRYCWQLQIHDLTWYRVNYSYISVHTNRQCKAALLQFSTQH